MLRRSQIRVAVLATASFALIASALVFTPVAQAKPVTAPSRPVGSCDLYAAGATPCVAAHSSTRALYGAYNGPLYQVRRASDQTLRNIGIVAPTATPVPDAGGYADSAAQDVFCQNTDCVITRIYDQSGRGNDLLPAPPGTFKGTAVGGYNTLAIADMAPITVGRHKAYGVYLMPGMGYRNNNASYLPKDDDPQGLYMVFDGTHYDSGCCFDYGNTSTNSRAVGQGTMDTVYFGTATAWGRGSGPGPWIMSDMEAGLFSGYDSKLNEGSPTIDSSRFVTGSVNGGGGNRWDLRGGDAQAGDLTTYYSGPRPASLTNDAYFPMHRRGAIQIGNGGDNGNGSAGTFYEGVMTSGYPNDATIAAVQANIVAAKYDVQPLALSRLTTFTPGSAQKVTLNHTNTTGAVEKNVQLSLAVPTGWSAVISGTKKTTLKIGSLAPGGNARVSFTVNSRPKTMAGLVTGKAQWTAKNIKQTQSTSVTEKVRNVLPIKINEVRYRTSTNATDQFIELYNPTGSTINISSWTLTNTPSGSAAVTLATVPAGTKLRSGAYYLLGLSNSGLAAPARQGTRTINVRDTTGFVAGQTIQIGSGPSAETAKVTTVDTAATIATTVWIPVTHGSITVPAGSTNIPVTSAAGFVVGQQIGIGAGSTYEQSTVTDVGTAAAQTTLSAAATAGSANIKVAANTDLSVGDSLTVDAGEYREVVTVKTVGTTGAGGTGVELASPLRLNHRSAVDVAGRGTGIRFTPAIRRPHPSGEAVRALGGGVTLDRPLSHPQVTGASVVDSQVTTTGYQAGGPAPDQWFGGPLSVGAGSIALRDATGGVLVDAIVYGSQQSSSSGNGTITSPEIAVLEGDQSAGGCTAIVASAATGSGRSNARWPNGYDSDNLCDDFVTTSLPTPGAANSF